MDLDLQQFLTERARKDATIKASDAVIMQLQECIKAGLQQAIGTAETTAQQVAMKDAALACRDEQIAALNAKLAQFEQDAAWHGVPVHQAPHTARPYDAKQSRQVEIDALPRQTFKMTIKAEPTAAAGAGSSAADRVQQHDSFDEGSGTTTY
jgi:hypothetical protein